MSLSRVEPPFGWLTTIVWHICLNLHHLCNRASMAPGGWMKKQTHVVQPSGNELGTIRNAGLNLGRSAVNLYDQQPVGSRSAGGWMVPSPLSVMFIFVIIIILWLAGRLAGWNLWRIPCSRKAPPLSPVIQVPTPDARFDYYKVCLLQQLFSGSCRGYRAQEKRSERGGNWNRKRKMV